MTIQTLSIVVDILGSVAVFSAIVFGLVHIRQFNIQRRDLAAIELVRSVQDNVFTNAYQLIHSLPENTSGEEFNARGTEYINAALSIGILYETVGLLVYKRVVPISIAEELVGGVAITLWKRLCPWVELMRKEQSQELFLEWFQWLVDRFKDRNRDHHLPAHIRFADWQE